MFPRCTARAGHRPGIEATLDSFAARYVQSRSRNGPSAGGRDAQERDSGAWREDDGAIGSPCCAEGARRRTGPGDVTETVTVPPAAGMILSLSSAKKPMDWLSGDQNGRSAPSVRSSRRTSVEFIERSQSMGVAPGALATNTMLRPSGEGTTSESERWPRRSPSRARSRETNRARRRGLGPEKEEAPSGCPSASAAAAAIEGRRPGLAGAGEGAAVAAWPIAMRASPISRRRVRTSRSRQRARSARTCERGIGGDGEKSRVRGGHPRGCGRGSRHQRDACQLTFHRGPRRSSRYRRACRRPCRRPVPATCRRRCRGSRRPGLRRWR